jgi:hypothetical protein
LPHSPYVGPRPFETGEKLYGRGREVNDLPGLLIAERIVLLHSPSGAGKTSLVEAVLARRNIAESQLRPVSRPTSGSLPTNMWRTRRPTKSPFRHRRSAPGRSCDRTAVLSSCRLCGGSAARLK